MKENKQEQDTQNIAYFREQLLTWYDRHGRDLPWRYKRGGGTPDPYKIWLSEIMCQQTTVQAVIPYFLKFTSLWPSINHLAKAPQEQIMTEWAGLGYYARARNLHKCAGIIANDLGGVFPKHKEDLQKLPGIGDYTSAAITALAFNTPATVVDGNIERVMARYFAITDPLPKVKPHLKKLAIPFFKDFHDRPGDLPQAFMDLGAMVCTPKSPKCMICPISKNCQGRIQNIAETLPAKIKIKNKPQKIGYVYWVENHNADILLERRSDSAMLGGMMGFPTSEWLDLKEGSAPEHLPFLNIKNEDTQNDFIKHSFTHFDLKLFLMKSSISSEKEIPLNFTWSKQSDLQEIGFPTLFKKPYKLWKKQD